MEESEFWNGQSLIIPLTLRSVGKIIFLAMLTYQYKIKKNITFTLNTGYNQRGFNNFGGQQRQDQYHWRGGQQSGGQGSGKSVSFHDSFGGSNQNRFSALDPGGGGAAAQKTDGQDLKPNEIM